MNNYCYEKSQIRLSKNFSLLTYVRNKLTIFQISWSKFSPFINRLNLHSNRYMIANYVFGKTEKISQISIRCEKDIKKRTQAK